MARATGISQSTVSRTWRAFGLKPHLVQEVKVSSDPQFIDKVHDIVGLYLNPPEAAVVLCVNEKTQVQALDRTSPVLPLMLGAAQRRSHDYRRHGTTNLYPRRRLGPGDPLPHRPPPSRRVPALPPPHRRLGARPPQRAPRVGQLLDPQDACGAALVGSPPTLTFHFTPTYSSWLNLVERWFAELTTKWRRRGTHRSVRELVASIRTWITNWNDEPRPFVWHKTADEILDSLATYCQRINDLGH